VVIPRPRVDLLVHLRLSDDASGAAAERDALFRLDEASDNRFGEEYDGSDVDEGPFGTRRDAPSAACYSRLMSAPGIHMRR